MENAFSGDVDEPPKLEAYEQLLIGMAAKIRELHERVTELERRFCDTLPL